MTTRRRRAGSETCGEEQPPGVTPAQTVPPTTPQTSTILTQESNGIKVPWAGVTDQAGQSQAYYKKTDSPQTSTQLGNPLLWTSTDAHTWNLPNTWQQQQQSPVAYPTSAISGNTVPSNNVSWPQQPPWQNNDIGQTYNNYTGYSINSIGHGVTNGEVFPVNTSADLTESGDMASRDRTQEFVRIIRSQQGSQSNGAIPQRNTKRSHDIRQYSEFMLRSKSIGKNISSTYAKLEKLTHLAKKRSLFDDSQDHEIQELTGIIRHDLTALTKQLEDLRNKSRIHSTSVTHGSGHLQKHSANLVGSLQTKVASITQRFKDVLEVRTENLKKQAERRDHFTGGAVSGQLPTGAVAGHHQGSVLLADEVASSNETDSLLGATGGGGEVAINMGGGMYQQQLNLMEEQDTYMQSRADTMRTIESTIVELGQMFTQLATMVMEQDELVHRIDTNVDDAEMNVEAAHSELLKYFKNVSSNRWLMIKVFGIMIVFFVVFVVFMA